MLNDFIKAMISETSKKTLQRANRIKRAGQLFKFIVKKYSEHFKTDEYKVVINRYGAFLVELEKIDRVLSIHDYLMHVLMHYSFKDDMFYIGQHYYSQAIRFAQLKYLKRDLNPFSIATLTYKINFDLFKNIVNIAGNYEEFIFMVKEYAE